MPRNVFERTGYLSSFPDLIGSVSTFTGDNADHRKLMDVARVGRGLDRAARARPG